MVFSLHLALQWLAHYKYWVIFPIAVVEGPMVTVLAGFLSSQGQLNFLTAYAIIAIADLAGDALYYLLGRFGRQAAMAKVGRFFGVTPERIMALEKHFANHPKKIFIAGKMAHGIGTVVLAAAGFAKVPFRKFIFLNIFPTLFKSLILLAVGYYFGRAYEHINTYLDYSAIAIGIICAGLYVGLIRYSNRLIKS